MKKTKEDAALTRKVLIDAALSVFSHKGYAQATLEEVAKEAGVTRGAIYWHFGNKFEMFYAVLQELYKKAEVRVRKIIDSDQRPLVKLHHLMQEFFLIVSNEEEFGIIEEVQLFKARKGEEFSRLYKDHVENVETMRELLIGIVREGIAAGEFDSNLDPEVTVVALLSYIAGIKSAWLSGIADISIAKNAEKLADIFIKGIAGGR
ncbi:MAG: TetR family transcriptional regulator [Candidatus Aminicenantes bacterium]|jgi:TetR/AcrR family acrAB operon transcriptional repressor